MKKIKAIFVENFRKSSIFFDNKIELKNFCETKSDSLILIDFEEIDENHIFSYDDLF